MKNPTMEILPEDAKTNGAWIRADVSVSAAAWGIASLRTAEEIIEDYTIPGTFARRAADTVAEQVVLLSLTGTVGNKKGRT